MKSNVAVYNKTIVNIVRAIPLTGFIVLLENTPIIANTDNIICPISLPVNVSVTHLLYAMF